MMAALAARGVALGEAAADRARQTVAAELRAALPDATVEIERDGVAVSGRRLAPLDDPALLWVGGLLR